MKSIFFLALWTAGSVSHHMLLRTTLLFRKAHKVYINAHYIILYSGAMASEITA